MSRFFGRLTKQELLYTFAFCSLPIHIWTISNVLYDVPAWMLYMDLWDLTGAISYALAFALIIETIPIFLLLTLAGWFAPKRWLRGNFVVLSLAFMLVATVMALVILNNERLLWDKGLLLKIFVAVYAVLAALIYLFPRIKEVVEAIAERVVVLVYIYLFFDVLAVIVVFVRNI